MVDWSEIAEDNIILDTRIYEVEYADGYKRAMRANAIASNLLSQFNKNGYRFVLLNGIIDLRIYGTQVKEGGSFIHMSNENKRRRETTK